MFQRFTSLDALQGIGQNLLVRFLEPFTADLAAKGIPHPNPNLPDHSYFQAAATLFALPELLPPRLSEALSAIEEMSHPECRRRIETALSELQSTTATAGLPRQSEATAGPSSLQDSFTPLPQSPENFAIQAWLALPALLASLETYTLPPCSAIAQRDGESDGTTFREPVSQLGASDSWRAWEATGIKGEGGLSVSSTLNPQPPFLAVCELHPPNCNVTPLTQADITPLELNWSRLGRALCQAFGCYVKLTDIPIPNTMQIGSWSADAVPVILTIQAQRQVFRRAIPELVARLRQPFILFAPTSRFLEANSQELLANVSAGFFALDSNLILTDHGTLQPRTTPGVIFASFRPETRPPLEEDAARQVVAIVHKLDSEGPAKPPTVHTVFYLYCVI